MPTPMHRFAIFPRLPRPKAGLSRREVMGIWHGHRTFYPRISTPGYSSNPCLAVFHGPSHQGSHPNKSLPARATPNRTLPWTDGLQLPVPTMHDTKCGHQMLYPSHPLPRAAGMSYHKLCYLTLLGGKSQRLSLGAAGLHSFLEALPARIPDSLPCQLPEATHSPWLMAPSSLFKASDVPAHITSL